MSSTFKWLVFKAASAVARNTSSLFYQLIYREIYREILLLTDDYSKTMEIAYFIGYKAAKESALRQIPVFRLFPSDATKLLDYFPLIWQINFGVSLTEYTREWDYSDPNKPVHYYIIKDNPLNYGMGPESPRDPDRDNLIWSELTDGTNNYGAIMVGLLTSVISFILKIKNSDKRIIITNPESIIQGGNAYTLKFAIIPKEEFPFPEEEDHTSDGLFDNIDLGIEMGEKEKKTDFWKKITDYINIEQLDDIFSSDTGLLRTILSKGIEKATHMPALDFMDHFTNDEEKVIQIIGYIGVHLVNEYGQFLDKLMEKENTSKVIGHMFLFIKENIEKFVPVSTIGEIKNYFAEVFEEMAPAVFVENLRNIPSEDVVQLILQGMQKALIDIGVDFSALKESIKDEFKKSEEEKIDKALVESASEKERKEQKNQLMEEFLKEFMIVSTALITLPSQIAIVVLYNTISGSSEIFSNLFNSLKDSIQKIVDLFEELKE
ncbi:hypothetical protein DSAG12_02085 [Promethearchaeum syntrophicum]|uniref:Uncharacterized protein n=1 Tax=Promethearchaeum syntrophicum TaxID=2594042 RepID=A0A5B9DB88_9ARCH|nr:hypothetical protein [Candidatus Prometheoarchaeum syntrophicum]QEE16255.1 hypothetical protein DSAG12_02085 [Candidatus Prometheoarchaeum syntrophicum]